MVIKLITYLNGRTGLTRENREESRYWGWAPEIGVDCADIKGSATDSVSEWPEIRLKRWNDTQIVVVSDPL
jgi:hypothetical protein